jgi:hypothetical protein
MHRHQDEEPPERNWDWAEVRRVMRRRLSLDAVAIVAIIILMESCSGYGLAGGRGAKPQPDPNRVSAAAGGGS